MSWSSIRPVTLAILLASGCASSARDVTSITPVPETPLPGSSRMDGAVDSGGGLPDAGMGPCAPDYPNVCANAATNTVVVGPGQSTSLMGVIDNSGDDFFAVTFTSATGASTPYHPRIALGANPGNAYSFETLLSCGNPVAGCSGTGTLFEQTFPGTNNACDPPGNCIDNDTRDTSFVVRVHRTGSLTICFAYRIDISNVP